MRTLLLLLLGCTPPETEAETPFDTVSPPEGWWEEDPGDIDGDGVSAAEGDCDELRADVHPYGQDTTCDGVDQDCSGTADDAAPGDDFEPNDGAPADLGDLGEAGERVLVATAFPQGDVDAYTFTVEDGVLSVFDVEAWLYDVPAGVDVALELTWTADGEGAARGVVATADEAGPGGDEFLDWTGTALDDDSGRYTLRVVTTGETCARSYLLQVLVGSW